MVAISNKKLNSLIAQESGALENLLEYKVLLGEIISFKRFVNSFLVITKKSVVYVEIKHTSFGDDKTKMIHGIQMLSTNKVQAKFCRNAVEAMNFVELFIF